jgi:hypothetical protein
MLKITTKAAFIKGRVSRLCLTPADDYLINPDFPTEAYL